jgi:hypothetical protein
MISRLSTPRIWVCDWPLTPSERDNSESMRWFTGSRRLEVIQCVLRRASNEWSQIRSKSRQTNLLRALLPNGRRIAEPISMECACGLDSLFLILEGFNPRFECIVVSPGRDRGKGKELARYWTLKCEWKIRIVSQGGRAHWKVHLMEGAVCWM